MSACKADALAAWRREQGLVRQRKWCPCGDSNTDCPRFKGGDSYRLVYMGMVRAEGFEPATILLLRQSPPTVGLRAHGAGWTNRTPTSCLQGKTSATKDKPAYADRRTRTYRLDFTKVALYPMS